MDTKKESAPVVTVRFWVDTAIMAIKFSKLCVAGLGLLISACASMPTTESPYLSVVNIQLAQATPLEQRYRITVRVQNPNDHDLNVTGLKYALKINDQPFLKGVSDTAFTVPRYGEHVTEVSGISTIFGFVRQIQELGAASGLSYELSGRLSLENRMLGLPFSYQGRLTPPGDAGRERSKIPAQEEGLGI